MRDPAGGPKRRGESARVQGSSVLFVMLSAIVVVAIVAKRFSIPYPIAFVVGGSLMAFAPQLPPIEIDPDLVFLIILPPLLFSGGWLTDWQMFTANARPIGLLAIGLVVATTGAVGLAAHALMPQIGWASAFVLGAIISPPDAVAAGAVFERFSVPRRILAILDGEGLVNDATALVIYGFGVTAVLTRSFSLASAGFSFVVVAVGGIALGLGFGFANVKLLTVLRKYDLTDHLIGTTIQLILPYTIYLSGQALHVSGVLATVTAGIFVSRKANLITNAAGRIVAFAVWDLLIFLLNGFAFLLIGLELRSIVHDPSFARREIWIGLEISLLVIAVRFAWVYPATYLPRLIFPSINRREGLPGWNYIFIIAWSGMRGIVSLASALALPLTMNDGRAFPGRDEIIFISFCVIFITLVFQGLSLIPLLKWLRIDGDDLHEREIEVRVAALRAGIAGLHALEPSFNSTEEWEVEGRILGEYEYRIAHLLGHLDGSVSETDVAYDHQLQQQALEAERREIARLRESGEIPDDVFRNIQYDLDLADERLN